VIIGLLLAGLASWILSVKQEYDSIDAVALGPIILLLIVGVIIIATALIGCIGASCDKLWPLRIFLGVIILVFVLQVVVGILAYVYRDRAIEKFGERIGFAVPEYTRHDGIKKAVDKIQDYWNCCGIKEYKDWDKNDVFKCNGGSCSVPDSCCVESKEKCGQSLRRNPNNNLQVRGCEGEFRTWVEHKLDVIGATALAMAILHILGIFVVYMFITKVEDRIRLFKYRKRFYS